MNLITRWTVVSPRLDQLPARGCPRCGGPVGRPAPLHGGRESRPVAVRV
jgi:hypothetical protein